MRHLASIQRVLELRPIDGADKIEVATVLGWQVVVKKDEFKVGDLCIYIEIDSVLPNRPEFAFMEPRGFRVKTIRLRGQISQGLCFSLGILPFGVEMTEGLDITEALGVIKYEPVLPACLAGNARGNRPDFVPKTDETRIQAAPRVLERWATTPLYVTEKLDGSSTSFYLKDGVFGVCSRNLDLMETEGNAFWQVARRDNWPEKLKVLADSLDIKDVVVQGELIGPGIQGNKYGLKRHEIYLFNIFNVNYHAYERAFHFISQAHSLPTVPNLGKYEGEYNVKSLVDFSIGNSALAASPREGIVLRPFDNFQDPELGRLSFKVINPEFLLKNEE